MGFSNIIRLVVITILIPITGATQVINKDSSVVAFELSNLRINTVQGTIKGFDGDVLFDAGDISNSFFRVCIDPATVNSGIDARDRALLGEDYFDVENYPEICFNSEDISQTEVGFLSTGTLTIKGVSRQVSIPFTSEDNRLTGSLEIDRADFGVGPGSGFLVGKTVKLEIVCVFESNNS